MTPSKFCPRPEVHPGGQAKWPEIRACGKAAVAEKSEDRAGRSAAPSAPVDGCGKPSPVLRFKGFAEGRRLLARLVLGLAGLLDQGARALRHLAQRRDDVLHCSVYHASSDPLGRFLAECVQGDGDVRLDALNGSIGQGAVDAGEAGGKVAEGPHHQAHRKLRCNSVDLHRLYVSWCEQHQEAPLASCAQAGGVR